MGKNEIAYHVKDITSKYFGEHLKEKSLKVYGLDIPKIVQVLPTNLPVIEANELRIDNLFLLEDGTIAIIDYESSYKTKDKLKYLSYIIRVLKRYQKEKNTVRIRMLVLYTADVKRKTVKKEYDVGTLHFEIEPAFLSELDSEEIVDRLTKKIENGERLTDEEMMEFIILPLTYRTKQKKKEAIETSISLAKKVKDENSMVFLLSGILVFTDKVIDKETGNRVKEWIMMTKVGRLFEEEKQQAVKQAASEALRKGAYENAVKVYNNMIERGYSEEEARLLSGISDFTEK